MQTRHFTQLIGLSALWGASFLFIRIASPVLGPNVLAGLRVGLATATLAIVMRMLKHQWPWRQWKDMLVLALLAVAVPFVLYAWASLRLPAGYTALLNTTVVLFGTLSSAWVGQDKLTARKLLGCACGFAGVALILGLGPIELSGPNLLAVGACLMAAGCYGMSTPLAKKATAHLEPLAIAAAIHLAALVFVLPGALWSLPQAQFTLGAMAAVFVMGVLTSGLAFWVHLRIIRQVTPVAAMAPAFLIPVFGVAWGHLFLGEALSSGIFVGGALVLLATALVTGFNPLRKPTPITEP